ncbi:helix-turn-helix domain-containing protein [Celeribacter baekdonensis]|uniref:AraC family transcriptional regulator n=3 Tax=Roseobacteraceae TaxID=2854170 RepID=K2J6F4_9RHOB|nr:helix-turn-helix domain-containing protein [Celeribacter baekdonensis]EKE70512.1 AraC family transcriptional regulator [Celeribacter baekdonensis B30]|tara:strand:+ start:6893 stop:7798 length:906 start_codon:yes stop_codon:yes gene_type:complete
MLISAEQPIPRYYLYGDTLAEVELDFIHVEPIRDRSGANDWTIRAHAHPDHVQLLFVERGGGEIQIEARTYAIPVPAMVVIPVAMVHEIRFLPGTDGFVITAACTYAKATTQGDARFADALEHPAAYALIEGDPNCGTLRESFEWMRREYTWNAPGRRLAIKAQFERILVALMRLRLEVGAEETQRVDRDYDLLCRYREILETHFKSEKGLEFYASKLGVSIQRLNLACKARVGKTASQLLHERVVIEAKRCLIYMTMTVAEVGYDLGFEDPAYFSRFFSQRVGQPPGAYRETYQTERQKA